MTGAIVTPSPVDPLPAARAIAEACGEIGPVRAASVTAREAGLAMRDVGRDACIGLPAATPIRELRRHHAERLRVLRLKTREAREDGKGPCDVAAALYTEAEAAAAARRGELAGCGAGDIAALLAARAQARYGNPNGPDGKQLAATLARAQQVRLGRAPTRNELCLAIINHVLQPAAWPSREAAGDEAHAIFARAVRWQRTGDADAPFAAEGPANLPEARLTLRLNDFPREPLFTLLRGETEIAALDDWPTAWTR